MLRRSYRLCSRTAAVKLPIAARRHLLVLGIETSCDDTAAAVVDESGRILGEASHSQQQYHTRAGGISPAIAQVFHEENIDNVVQECLHNAGTSYDKLDGVAVTNRPGLVLCLRIGVAKAVSICRRYDKPLIPVHHMRAHALTASMENPEVKFPHLCLLISGGHSLLTYIQDVEKFALLGRSYFKSSPGEALDKVARELRLGRLGEDYSNISGGEAIERVAAKAIADGCHLDMSSVDVHPLEPKTPRKNCDFWFGGLKSAALMDIEKRRLTQNLSSDQLLSDYGEFCVRFQCGIFYHMARRVQRAIEIFKSGEFDAGLGLDFTSCDSLVVSGGVASNAFIRSQFETLLAYFNYGLVVPRAKLCRDNGAMIAWNGLLMLQKESEMVIPPTAIPDIMYVLDKEPIGDSWIDEISAMDWQCKNTIRSIFKYQNRFKISPEGVSKSGNLFSDV